jgi:hypothetical protein
MLMRIISLPVTVAVLAGWSAETAEWRSETVPVATLAAPVPQVPKPRRCAPIAVDVTSEAERVAPLSGALSPASVDLTAALLVSEVRKNQRLHEAAAAYEKCRRL